MTDKGTKMLKAVNWKLAALSASCGGLMGASIPVSTAYQFVWAGCFAAVSITLDIVSATRSDD